MFRLWLSWVTKKASGLAEFVAVRSVGQKVATLQYDPSPL